MPRYPANSEHEYLQWIAHTDYMLDRDNCDGLLLAANAALMAGDEDEYQQLWADFRTACQEVYDRRWRREEVIDRLHIDTQLRQEGKTFADVYEREQPVSNKPF